VTAPTLDDAFARLRAGTVGDEEVYRALAPVYRALYASRGRIDGQFDLVASVTPTDGRVLELGCGTGDLLGRLRAYEAVGVDPSPAMCRLAGDRTGGAAVVTGTASALAPGSVDTVAAMGAVLGHVPVEALDETLANVRDALRPGGRFVCSVHARVGVETARERERARAAADGPTGGYERELTAETGGYRITQRDRREPGSDGRFTWHVRYELERLADGATVATDQRVRLRAFDGAELRERLANAGLTVERVDPREFVTGDAEDDRALVAVARRR
jgi:SAM-dependent methyltransferase